MNLAPNMVIDLELQIATTETPLPDQAQFELWLSIALQDVTSEAAIAIRLVDETESQALNSQYRGKDKPTNILSFPFELPEGLPAEAANGMLGDLVICAPIVQQEADLQQKPIMDHWAHLVMHGALHLLGYDHIEEQEAERMEALERQLLGQLGIPDPYLLKNTEQTITDTQEP